MSNPIQVASMTIRRLAELVGVAPVSGPAGTPAAAVTFTNISGVAARTQLPTETIYSDADMGAYAPAFRGITVAEYINWVGAQTAHGRTMTAIFSAIHFR